MATIRRHPGAATVLGGVLMVLVLWALLPTPFVGEAEAANPLLESLVAKVDALQADVAALAGDDLAGQLGDHHDAVVVKLGDLADQLADHDDALAEAAGVLDDCDDKLDDLVADGSGESAACCSWSKRLDNDDRWVDVFSYIELDGSGAPVTKYAAVLDQETGLVWTLAPVLVDDYNDALIAATEHVASDGTCGWRLATADEFATLLHKDTSGRLQLPTGGPFTWPTFGYDGSWFWTSTAFVASSAEMRVVWSRVLDAAGAAEWAADAVAYDDSSGDGYVLLVRGPGGMQH